MKARTLQAYAFVWLRDRGPTFIADTPFNTRVWKALAQRGLIELNGYKVSLK